jgi:hypothetical protein
MALATCSITIRVSWWVVPYIKTCCFFAIAMGLDPDKEKMVTLIADHGLRVERMRWIR